MREQEARTDRRSRKLFSITESQEGSSKIRPTNELEIQASSDTLAQRADDPDDRDTSVNSRDPIDEAIDSRNFNFDGFERANRVRVAFTT